MPQVIKEGDRVLIDGRIYEVISWNGMLTTSSGDYWGQYAFSNGKAISGEKEYEVVILDWKKESEIGGGGSPATGGFNAPTGQ